MSEALIPRLTRLDEQVLDEIPREGAVRTTWVVYALRRSASEREVREILQGLHHLGVLRCGRGGWWRRSGAWERA